MTTITPGALVHPRSFADAVWFVRCPTARNGFWHIAQDRKQARAIMQFINGK